MPSVCAQTGSAVVQVVRAGPDVHEDQGPEVDDRQPIGIDRPFRPLRHEIVHDGEEAGGEEEADRVMAVPPLHQGILHAGEDGVGLGAEGRDRQRQVVDDVEHRHRDDEGEIEPVRHEDVGFLALPERAEEHEQIDDPDDGQPQIGVPFRLGIFLPLRHTEQVARAGDDDEEIVAQHHEPRRQIARDACARGLLHDVERGREQHVAAEGEDHRRRAAAAAGRN